MSFINHQAKEIHCKIVYYGPSLSGKTTNLQYLYSQIDPKQKTEIVELPTDIERTLFFDFLPIDVGTIRGYKMRFHIYTVPGQQVFEGTRRIIIKGLDGVVFVADSQKSRLMENIKSFESLKSNIERYGINIKKLPMVMQYNKRDLDDIYSVSEMRRQLNHYNFPDIESVAFKGEGVFDSLKVVIKSIVTQFKKGETKLKSP